MTNAQLFTEAHKIAKQTVAYVGDYRIAFSLALKELKQPKVIVDINVAEVAFASVRITIGLVCVCVLFLMAYGNVVADHSASTFTATAISMFGLWSIKELFKMTFKEFVLIRKTAK